jgi:hypothetical protein
MASDAKPNGRKRLWEGMRDAFANGGRQAPPPPPHSLEGGGGGGGGGGGRSRSGRSGRSGGGGESIRANGPEPWEPPSLLSPPWRPSAAHLTAHEDHLRAQLHRLLTHVSAAHDGASIAHDGASIAHDDASAGEETASERAKRLAVLLEEVGMDLLPALLVQLPFLFLLGMLTLLLGERLLPASASWATHVGISVVVSVMCARALGKRVLLPSVPYLGW